MTISKYNSQKITILSFISIILVLYIHGYYVEAGDFPAALALQQFVGTNGLALVAVPLFYAISGLLFFKNVQSISDCKGNIKKRIKSLLVPYILWNVIFVLWFVLLSIVPGVSGFVNSNILGHFKWSDLWESFRFLFIEPAGFHLWFLRDLLLFTAFSPLLYLGLKHKPWLTFLILYLTIGRIGRCGISYFALGGIIALHYDLDKVSHFLSRPVVLICALVYLFNCILVGGSHEIELGFVQPYFKQLLGFLGIITVWRAYDFVIKEEHEFPKSVFNICGYSFFIYLFHEPTFNIIKKLSLSIVGTNEISLILLYLVNPIVICMIAVLVGLFIQRLLPKLYSLLVGGRL